MIVRSRFVVVPVTILLTVNPSLAWVGNQPGFHHLKRRLHTTKRRSSSADIEQPSFEDSTAAPAYAKKTIRSKINEIDYCIDPADVSLNAARNSMTYALNDASNRVVRRILLARSWKSPEALNQSLVQQAKKKQSANPKDQQQAEKKKSPRSDSEYVADQLQAFQDKYGALENFAYAKEYIDCILALATQGVESEQVVNVYQHKVYAEAYRRVLSVLKTVGVSFLITTTNESNKKQRVLAPKLKDQDICLSVMDKLRSQRQQQQTTVPVQSTSNKELEPTKKKQQPRIRFWGRKKNKDAPDGILLCKDEPSITLQLNTVSNIVKRALLFGGDEELLVIMGTLESDREGFIQCWWEQADSGSNADRPGLDYLDALIALLRSCYDDRVISSLEPKVKLSNSYANAYERLMATAVELGSGYFKPEIAMDDELPKPRTPKEELGRFALWETKIRLEASDSADLESRPDDLVGTWQVKDVVGGQTIGVTNVTFQENGFVQVAEPLEGRRWRLDPGPTHLDTCQFQVMTADGNLLNYRGFIDRGARLEARFSGRQLRIRGSVMFQMRDGATANSYYKDIIPINYGSGTTKFVMTKDS